MIGHDRIFFSRSQTIFDFIGWMVDFQWTLSIDDGWLIMAMLSASVPICESWRRREREENNIKGADDVVHLNIDRRQNSSIKQRDYISTDPFNWTDQQKAWNNRTSNMLTHTHTVKTKLFRWNKMNKAARKYNKPSDQRANYSDSVYWINAAFIFCTTIK